MQSRAERGRRDPNRR